MTAALARLESEISSLRDELDALKETLPLREPGLRVPIQSLDPEPIEVVSPLEAVIRPVGDGFVATFFDANVNASGETESEAFENLKDMLVATLTELRRLGEERLGPEPARQLAVLKRFLRPREEAFLGRA
ncbi:MAG TPA: hypothetical protein VGG06_21215 [Thermoanaerobaculia bacterium]|jgi:predicted RNase H-like HicB family nuclease